MLAFAIQIKHGLGDEMTAYDIARKIDLRPTSPNFRDLLSQMVMDGLLKCREIEKEGRGIGGKATLLYSPASPIVPEKRTISVRANGKQAGQLELF
jgi:hypothetical protein